MLDISNKRATRKYEDGRESASGRSRLFIDVDRAYCRFWKKRGMKPPPVASYLVIDEAMLERSDSIENNRRQYLQDGDRFDRSYT